MASSQYGGFVGDKISRKQGLGELSRFDESIQKLFEETQRKREAKQGKQKNHDNKDPIELLSNPINVSPQKKER